MGRNIKYTRKIHCSKCKSVITIIPETNDEKVIKSYQNICNNCVRKIEDVNSVKDGEDK